MTAINRTRPEIVGANEDKSTLSDWFRRTFRAGSAFLDDDTTPPPATGGGGMPGWVLPVAIGGVGLVAVVMLTKK